MKEIFIQAAMSQLAVPVLVAVAIALGTYALSWLPGPVRDALTSMIHKRDMELLLGAMFRAALAGKSVPQIIEYVAENTPGTLNKLAPNPDAITTMATAMEQAVAKGINPTTAINNIPAGPGGLR